MRSSLLCASVGHSGEFQKPAIRKSEFIVSKQNPRAPQVPQDHSNRRGGGKQKEGGQACSVHRLGMSEGGGAAPAGARLYLGTHWKPSCKSCGGCKSGSNGWVSKKMDERSAGLCFKKWLRALKASSRSQRNMGSACSAKIRCMTAPKMESRQALLRQIMLSRA